MARKGFAASPLQRHKVAGESSILSGRGPCDPCHVIDRSLLTVGQDDELAVVALTRDEHRAYDEGALDLLPSLEVAGRDELAFAVKRFGLLRTLERVTNQRWCPIDNDARRAA